MNRGFRIPWRTAAALAAVLLALGVSGAQPPGGRDGDGREPAARADKDVEAWVKVLAEKITDRHDSVRDSARGALVAIGEPALPTLRKLADGEDGAAAEAARHVIGQIEQGRGGPGGFSPGPGFGGPGGTGIPGGPAGGPPRFPGPGGSSPPGFGPPGGNGPPGGFAPPGSTSGAPPGFGPPGVGNPFGPPGGVPGGAMRPGGRGAVEHALDDLNLSDKQKGKAEEVFKAHQEKVRQAVEKMHEDLLKAMKEVLDDEQYQKFEKAVQPSGPSAPSGGAPGQPRQPAPF